MKIRTSSALFGLLYVEAQAGCPADFSFVGCYADSVTERIFTSRGQHNPMSAGMCYMFCDDGVNTHFGMQYSSECWCGIHPELNKHDEELAGDKCDFLCVGTTTGEICGGFLKMSVFEITAYEGCHHESLHLPIGRGSPPLSGSEDSQINGQPWDYQEKIEGANVLPTQGVLPGTCDGNDDDDHKKLLSQIRVWEAAAKTEPRIFCGISTRHQNHRTNVKAIKETWASHCDGFVAFSDKTDHELNTFKIKQEGLDEDGNMWQKSRAIWKYINFHYKEDFDWFILGGDDLFLIVENLRKYLLSDEVKSGGGGIKSGGTNPMYLGRRLRVFGEDHRMYNNGRASYVLNQASVGLLASHLDDDDCQPHRETPWEDLLVSMCLKKNGVRAFDTRDSLGRERFHPFTPAAHFGQHMPLDPADRLASGTVVNGWYMDQEVDAKFGPEGCSSDSLSFNDVDEQLMRRLYHLVYSCQNDEVPHPESRSLASPVHTLVQIPEELTGWDLVERLHSIGLDSRADLARLLVETDPFKASNITAVGSPDKFECPDREADRFSLPDLRDHDKEEAFKAGQGFIYYQHLRKAGGTAFCDMASRNMLATELPWYFCMADGRGSTATPPWSDKDFFLETMQKHGYRLTSNEWDVFPIEHLALQGAIFATTLRHPVDRWYSQYRFEHLERRDGSRPGSELLPFDLWYKKIRRDEMGNNPYIKTFCGRSTQQDDTSPEGVDGDGRPNYARDLWWSYHKFSSWGDQIAWEDLKSAMNVLRRFNLVLVLEFVEDEMWALEEAFGWSFPRKQWLPDEHEAVRLDKKSVKAMEDLPSDMWTDVLNANVFDLLLFHWVKRLYLERRACRQIDQSSISGFNQD
ncbi:unnamed protein product [Ectocarpus fasciculatus]